ncbi:MAG: hypothetical protein IJ168_04835 [Eubacterium sp.]|nr:hypothetical protein [Eubacterium sp.]
MKKFLSVILVMLFVLGTVLLAGCSKNTGDGDDPSNAAETTAAPVAELPDGYEQITFDDTFYGTRFSTAFPTYEKMEEKSERENRHTYTVYTNAAEYKCYYMRVFASVTTEDGKEYAFGKSSGTVETIELNGLETCKHTAEPSSGAEVEYDIFIPFMDGYATVNVDVYYVNDDLTAEQWAEVLKAIETYTTFELLSENGLVKDGKLMDSSNTIGYVTPATIAGQSVELSQTLRMNDMLVVGTYEADGIPYKIYAEGTTTDSVYNSRKENTEDYTEVTSGDYTYYAHMINRFPNVECELYTEINGLYYEFYMYRNHDLDVDGNKAFVEDTANYQIFADMVTELLNGADINPDNFRE